MGPPLLNPEGSQITERSCLVYDEPRIAETPVRVSRNPEETNHSVNLKYRLQSEHRLMCCPFHEVITKKDSACVCVCGHYILQSMDQPGKVANPARGQLNREN